MNESDKLYRKLDRKAAAIVTKLRNEIAAKGYRENLGQTELRKYSDEVQKHSSVLTYQECHQLTQSLSITIDNL